MRYVQVGKKQITVVHLAAVASKYWLTDKPSIVKVAHMELFGGPWQDYNAPIELSGEPPLATVHEYNSGFAATEGPNSVNGVEHWLGDGVDVMTVDYRRATDGETETVTLIPGLPYFVESWEDAFTADDVAAIFG